MNKYKWAILGAGNIAQKFAEGLQACSRAELYAVASRSQEKSQSFAKKFGFKKAYGSYSEMLADDDVDIVYIATPNNLHHEHTLLCLNAKKAVLCEKPISYNKKYLCELIETSKQNNCFLMEALWSRFLPSIIKYKELAFSGKYGKPLMLKADFGFKAEFNKNSRLFDPKLGGGAVYDIGIYPLFLALYLFGDVEAVSAESRLAETGTDATTSIILKHKSGEQSLLNCSFEMNINSEARLFCENGSLVLPHMFHMPHDITFNSNSNASFLEKVESESNGYNYEAEEVMNCLDKGLIESNVMPHSFSLKLTDLIDDIYKKIGATRWL